MSTIDLERLIVRQTYFIPVKTSKLKMAIAKELEAHDPSIGRIKAWILDEEHGNSFLYRHNLRHHFVRHQVMSLESGTREYKRLVR